MGAGVLFLKSRVVRYSGVLSQSEGCIFRKNMSLRAWAGQYLTTRWRGFPSLVLHNARSIPLLDGMLSLPLLANVSDGPEPVRCNEMLAYSPIG